MAGVADRREVLNALSIIQGARLPHPLGVLLCSFVNEAMNPVVASRYVLSLNSEGSLLGAALNWIYIVESVAERGDAPPSPDAIVRREIARRDGGRCCISGKGGTFTDPLVVLPILRVPSGWTQDKPGVIDMLGAFFGAPYRDWWLSCIINPTSIKPHHSYWLVRRSVAKAFSEGRLRLDRLQPSLVEYRVGHVLLGPDKPVGLEGLYPLLGDHSRSRIEKVDPRFIGSHARFSRSIRVLHVVKGAGWDAHSISSTTRDTDSAVPRLWLGSQYMSTWSSIICSAFLAIWTLLPSSLRIAAYESLRRLGERRYGPAGELVSVQRLPFGMYLKYNGEAPCHRNEFNALRTVRRFTSVPVPTPLDIVARPPTGTSDPSSSASSSPDPISYLLMSKLPGAPICNCHDFLSDADCRAIAIQLKDYLTQIRSIPPKQANPDLPISNTLGGAIRDPRIKSWAPLGPFPDEAAFSRELMFPDDPARRGHRTVFTHGDLNARNILVDRVPLSDGTKGWRVSGIVDWETAGYYPEYWDYTKAMFEGFRWSTRHNDLIKEVFGAFGDYSRELDVERRSWEAGDAICR